MSHITGTVQNVTVVSIGPDFGPPTSPPDTWSLDFAYTPAPSGTKLIMLHFKNVSLPGSNRIEVDLGYATDVFTSADGTDFWTRPANVYALGATVPVRYIRSGGAGGGAQIDQYGRGESHPGETGHPSISNCDPFIEGASYTEPTYDPFWYCANPPQWENVACVPSAADVRARVARSVGMIVSVEASDFTGIVQLSTCSVTLVDTDTVITAGHCHTPTEALSSSVTFDYQTDCSGGKPGGYNARFYKVKSVIAHHYIPGGGPDYSLLRLAEAPPGIPAIQIRHDIPAAGEHVFGIHHPNGAVKKLSPKHASFATVVSSNPNAISVPSTVHVSGGSSGSGLFDTAGRIAGILSNGDPCHSPTALYYYPTASALREIAPGPPTPITRDVMVVFDRSGSMSEQDETGGTKIEAARDALSLFVQLVRAGVGNRAGLVSFSTTASSPPDHAIAAVTTAEKTTLVGPPPYSGGKVGALTPGGATSIGEGLDAARLQFPTQPPGANPRAILLMTDGMENTPRWVSQVEGALAGIDVHAIGFGTAANLNGALLTSLTTAHSGFYTRAESGLSLEKFFSHAFGNIFEAGILHDPELDLREGTPRSAPESFPVCGEDSITVVLGWDRSDAELFLELHTPGGAVVTGGSPGVEESSGRTWTFLRVPLPHGTERDGTWQAVAVRPGGGGEFPPPTPALRFFVNVIPSGGARLIRVPDSKRYYTGDSINPMVYLRFDDHGWPANAEVKLTVSVPDTSIGNVLAREKLHEPSTVDGDTIPAAQATLAALEAASGKPMIGYAEQTFGLADDSLSTEGKFESGGVFGLPRDDLLKAEGSYTFHASATYAQGACTAQRQLLWSIHVDTGVDPDKTETTTTVTGTGPGGQSVGTITIVPRDRYGNNVGPGRGGDLTVTPAPGTTVTGPISDNGDGSYTVPVSWDPGQTGPGVVVGQPGRPPAVVGQPGAGEAEDDDLWWKILIAILILIIVVLVIVLLLT